MAISQDERVFFVALGSRIAQYRKDSHITQVQLAETLGVSQPTMNAYELGQRRVADTVVSSAGVDGLLFRANLASTKFRAQLLPDLWQGQGLAIARRSEPLMLL